MDLYNREIIGWSLHSDMSQVIIAKALKMALKHRRIDWAGFGLVFHSDRGSQYTAEATRRQLLRAGIRASGGKVACCFDNAVSESFYNRSRLHSSLGYLSPQQFLAKNSQLQVLQIAA